MYRVFLLLTLAAAAPAQTIFSQVDDILRALSDITGWKVRQSVPAEILSKNNFTVHIDVPVNAKRAAVTDHIEEAINTAGRPPGDLTINLGFQQPPEVVEFYQNFRGR